MRILKGFKSNEIASAHSGAFTGVNFVSAHSKGVNEERRLARGVAIRMQNEIFLPGDDDVATDAAGEVLVATPLRQGQDAKSTP